MAIRWHIIPGVISVAFSAVSWAASAKPVASRVVTAEIPLVQFLAEAESHRTARRWEEVVSLYRRVWSRVEGGESPPPGVQPAQVALSLAVALWEVQALAEAEAMARTALKRATSPGVQAECRLVLGLALAGQERFRDAVPVFRALTESSVHRRVALDYLARSAASAGLHDEARGAFRALVDGQPRDYGWGSAVLGLFALELDRKDHAAAFQTWKTLKEGQRWVENVILGDALLLRFGDGLLEAGDHQAALTVYRATTSRERLQQLQDERIRELDHQIAPQSSRPGAQVPESEASRQLAARRKTLTEAKEVLARTGEAYEARRMERLGRAYLAMGEAWEASLCFQRALTFATDDAGRESVHAGMIAAYAETRRSERALEVAEKFVVDFPQSRVGAEIFAQAAQRAAEEGSPERQLRLVHLALTSRPAPELRENLFLLRAHALSGARRFAEAHAATETYRQTYAEGQFRHEAEFLGAMALLLDGRSREAAEALRGFLAKEPGEPLATEAGFRLALALYASGHYTAAAGQAQSWLERHTANHTQAAEVLSLCGDIAVAQKDESAALLAYRQALERSRSDELTGYLLDEATKLYRRSGDRAAAVALWEGWSAAHPDHPFTLNAAFWIGKLRDEMGESEEGVTTMLTMAGRHAHDRTQDHVDLILGQVLATLTRAGKTSARERDRKVAEVVAFLAGGSAGGTSRVAEARSRLFQAEVARAQGDDAAWRRGLLDIAEAFKPDELPAALLARVGELLRAEGKVEPALAHFEQLVATAAQSPFADTAFTGLGEMALDAGAADEALRHFEDAIDRAGARFKLREASLGRARALQALGRLDEAQKAFEYIVGQRSWRGETTVHGLLALGEIALQRGRPEDLARAQGYFQRVLVAYRKHPPLVLQAYSRSGETFEKLGRTDTAVATYREALSDATLVALPGAKSIRRRLETLTKGGST